MMELLLLTKVGKSIIKRIFNNGEQHVSNEETTVTTIKENVQEEKTEGLSDLEEIKATPSVPLNCELISNGSKEEQKLIQGNYLRTTEEKKGHTPEIKQSYNCTTSTQTEEIDQNETTRSGPETNNFLSLLKKQSNFIEILEKKYEELMKTYNETNQKLNQEKQQIFEEKYNKIKNQLFNTVQKYEDKIEKLEKRYDKIKSSLKIADRQNLIMESRLAIVERESLIRLCSTRHRRPTATSERRRQPEGQRATECPSDRGCEDSDSDGSSYGSLLDEQLLVASPSKESLFPVVAPPPPPPPPAQLLQTKFQQRTQLPPPPPPPTAPGEVRYARMPVTVDLLKSVKLQAVGAKPRTVKMPAAIQTNSGHSPPTPPSPAESSRTPHTPPRAEFVRTPITVDLLKSVKLRPVGMKPGQFEGRVKRFSR